MNVQFNFITLMTLFRISVFLLIGIESMATFFLYQYGYDRYKPTKIISRLSIVFLSFGISTIYQAFIPFALMTDLDVHKYMTMFYPVILIPLYWALRLFRLESVKEDSKKLSTEKDQK